MNKKLVYICNSIDRLKLLDKYNFKDDFKGDLYIVSDDRYMTVYEDIIKFINEEATNPNIKNCKFVSMKNDIMPYVMSKMDIPGYEEDFKKLLFLTTLITPMYFCQKEDDIALVVEDDCLLFKNPYDNMIGLRTCSTKKLPATTASDEKLRDYFDAIKPGVLNTLGIDDNATDLTDILYKRFGKIISQATTTWTYLPDFAKYLSNFIKLSYTRRNLEQNRKNGCKLYHRGFAVTLELFVTCILIANNTTYYDDTEIILQDRSKCICCAKQISENAIIGYHYTIITDEFIFKFMPILLEQGFDKYKEELKKHEYQSQNKFAYLDEELTVGFSFNGKLKNPKKTEQTGPKLVRKRLF